MCLHKAWEASQLDTCGSHDIIDVLAITISDVAWQTQ